MNSNFEIILSDQTIESQWGNSTLSYSTSGATIHIQRDPLITIQKNARKLSAQKIPRFQLSGDNWDLESQWAFWQGAFQAQKAPSIDFAKLDKDQQTELEARIKVFTWVKTVVNQSPEDLSPVALAETAAQLIKSIAPDKVSYEIISGEDLVKHGMVGIHGVGRGSTRPPCLLKLDYCAQSDSSKPDITLVGKGITFDSGGYSLKSSEGMLAMKADMGGAATVTGALALAAARGLNRHVQLHLCCAENLVSGHAYKLGDILTYRNDVSVEIVNTDAEGRLVLADGLINASQSGANYIIDAATLTGAAAVAVGNDYNAVLSMDEKLVNRFLTWSEEEHEPHWRLPLSKIHREKCPSAFATTANSRAKKGGGTGGASNAAGFLSRFVNEEGKGWLHIDLAAAYNGSDEAMYAAGGTAMGVRSIARALQEL